MLESILAYINDHAWAQTAAAIVLFGTPALLALATGARGLASLNVIIGWFALLIMLGLLLI